MHELSSTVERRRALRVPVRGEAVLFSDDGRRVATLENLSRNGVLLLAEHPLAKDASIEIELRMLGGGGWITGRACRLERDADRWRVAVVFDSMDGAMRDRIDAAIAAAVSTVKSRPVLVIDDRQERRARLVEQLAKRGLTPLAARTPLEAMDYLTRTQMHVDICMLGRGYGLATDEIAEVLADSFPWVTTQTIDDDVEQTAERAFDAWSSSPVARIGTAIG